MKRLMHIQAILLTRKETCKSVHEFENNKVVFYNFMIHCSLDSTQVLAEVFAAKSKIHWFILKFKAVLVRGCKIKKHSAFNA